MSTASSSSNQVVMVVSERSFFSCCRTFVQMSATEFNGNHLSYLFKGQNHTLILYQKTGKQATLILIIKRIFLQENETKYGKDAQKWHHICKNHKEGGRNGYNFQKKGNFCLTEIEKVCILSGAS